MDYQNKNVGQMLQEVPIGDMIKSYAAGIADAQWELDKKSIAIALELLRAEVELPDETGRPRSRSLLELGFAPTFYQFQEATIEIAVTLSMRVEESRSVGLQVGVQHSRSSSTRTERKK